MLSLKVQSLPGTDIIEAIREMHKLSVALNVYTEQTINGKFVVVHPDDNPYEVHEDYKRAVERGFQIV